MWKFSCWTLENEKPRATRKKLTRFKRIQCKIFDKLIQNWKQMFFSTEILRVSMREKIFHQVKSLETCSRINSNFWNFHQSSTDTMAKNKVIKHERISKIIFLIFLLISNVKVQWKSVFTVEKIFVSNISRRKHQFIRRNLRCCRFSSFRRCRSRSEYQQMTIKAFIKFQSQIFAKGKNRRFNEKRAESFMSLGNFPSRCKTWAIVFDLFPSFRSIVTVLYRKKGRNQKPSWCFIVSVLQSEINIISHRYSSRIEDWLFDPIFVLWRPMIHQTTVCLQLESSHSAFRSERFMSHSLKETYSFTINWIVRKDSCLLKNYALDLSKTQMISRIKKKCHQIGSFLLSSGKLEIFYKSMAVSGKNTNFKINVYTSYYAKQNITFVTYFGTKPSHYNKSRFKIVIGLDLL